MNTEKIMEDIQSVQDNIREIKSTWGNTIMTLDNIKSGLKADVQKKVDEAYQRGHDDGYEAGCATAFKPVSDAEYQRGLDEAMSAFKKLYSCGWERDWKAMGFEFDEGEWSTSFEFIIGHYTAAEIVEKVKAYENKQKGPIEVGDVVERYVDGKLDSKGIYLQEDSGYWRCLFDTNGVLMTFAYPKEQFKKTGKHYDIQSILEAMKS